MAADLLNVFLVATMTGGLYVRHTDFIDRRNDRGHRETGVIDTATAAVLGVLTICVTVLTVTNHDIPDLLRQIGVAVLGGTLGAEAVTTVKGKIGRRKPPEASK